MSLWGDIAGTALGGVGGGVLAHYWDDLNKHGGGSRGVPSRPLLTAGDVKLVDPLKDPLSGINKKSQGSLQSALGRIQAQSLASGRASGRGKSSYIPQELNRASTIGSRGIEDTLYGSLGSVSLKDTLAALEHQRNLALVNEIGDNMSPSLLQEILGGLGAAGQAGANVSGIYNSLGKRGASGGPHSYGSSRASNFGLNYPQIPDFGYGQTYP
jgi:hypothetical protein